MPGISIIVPVYNVENYLHRCVDSILAQTFTDFELLLIDDGSSDNSGAICDDYAAQDDRVKVIHKKNGGVSSARNAGIRASEGEYIAFVDSDDYIDDELYDAVYSQCADNDITFFHYTVMQDGVRTKIYQKGLYELADDPRKYMRLYALSDGTKHEDVFFDESISVFCWRTLYRRSYIIEKNVYFDEKIQSGEDRLFLQTLLLHKPKIGVAEAQFGYFYCIRGEESLTGQKDRKSYVSGLYEHFKIFDAREQEICRQNPCLTAADLREIRMQRCAKMRQRVILNEFKYHSDEAAAEIKRIRNDEFFKTAISVRALRYAVKNGNWAETVKLVLIKLRMYKLLQHLYGKKHI